MRFCNGAAGQADPERTPGNGPPARIATNAAGNSTVAREALSSQELGRAVLGGSDFAAAMSRPEVVETLLRQLRNRGFDTADQAALAEIVFNSGRGRNVVDYFDKSGRYTEFLDGFQTSLGDGAFDEEALDAWYSATIKDGRAEGWVFKERADGGYRWGPNDNGDFVWSKVGVERATITEARQVIRGSGVTPTESLMPNVPNLQRLTPGDIGDLPEGVLRETLRANGTQFAEQATLRLTLKRPLSDGTQTIEFVPDFLVDTGIQTVGPDGGTVLDVLYWESKGSRLAMPSMATLSDPQSLAVQAILDNNIAQITSTSASYLTLLEAKQVDSIRISGFEVHSFLLS